MAARSSEIILFILLLVIIGLTRVYYGVADGPMVVWKGEFTYQDTLVNLGELLKMSPQQIEKEHRSVFYQLEEMGLQESADWPRRKGHKVKAQPLANPPANQAAPATANPPAVEAQPQPGTSQPPSQPGKSELLSQPKNESAPHPTSTENH